MRAKRAGRRQTQPDSRYQSLTVAKLINRAMRDGKKSVAQKQIYLALDALAKQTQKEATKALADVLAAITPNMEVRSRRVGGAAYQVPMPVSERRGAALAIRWLIKEASKRSSKEYHSFSEKLLAEMLDALKGEGGAVERRNTSHRMADANKAFAHFRW